MERAPRPVLWWRDTCPHACHSEVRFVSVLSDQVQTHTPSLVTFDLADTGATVAAAAEILQCFGHVDVLINNAGVSYRGAVLDTPVAVDKRVMETNYFGPVALTKGNVFDGRKGRVGFCVFTSLGSLSARRCLASSSVSPWEHTVIYSSGACLPDF